MRYVAIGGTLRGGSSSEAALRICADRLTELGHDVTLFVGRKINLAMYDPESPDRPFMATALVEAVRAADGVVLASPGYHGGVSGLVKNAIDYLEDTAHDPRPYLESIPVGIIGAAYGHQASVATATSLRTIAHALRGWPTPYAATINTLTWKDESGAVSADAVAALRLVADQMVAFGNHAPVPERLDAFVA
jgi:FMN reductase